MRAVCSSSSANCRVKPGAACSSQAARRLCGAARVQTGCNVAGGSRRAQQPASHWHEHVIGEAEVEAVTLLVQNNADDDAILAFLRSLGAEDVEHYEREAARLREELAASEAERYAAVAHLKEELADKTLRLQEAMADYLYVQGLFNLCGLMEYTQRMMVVSGVTWDDENAAGSWDAYITASPTLKDCLEEKGLDVEGAGAELAKFCAILSKDSHKPETQAYGSKLYIGPPLVQRQRELMACLCEHLYVPYTIAPDLMTDAEVGGGV